MNLLLDTHTLIWVFTGDEGLSVRARGAIRDGRNLVYVSAATAWEIAIKRAPGKLKAPDNLQEGLERYRFASLDISLEHALAVERLPAHHRDPFDRMLVAQARVEGMTLVTRDSRIKAYDVPILEA